MSEPAPIEVKWTWRRYVTIGVLVVCLGLVGAIVWRTTDPTALRWIASGLIAFAALAHAIYLTGPTATDLAKILGAIRGAPPSPPAPPV